jgi:hypothetical protein
MRYLQILNAVMLALGGALAVCMGVVCLLYGIYLDSEPQLRAEMPRLYAVTVAFAGMGLAGLAAFEAQRRRWLLRWLAQLLPVLPMIGLALVVSWLRR